MGVGPRATPAVDELLRVDGVGGEKDVLRGAVGELLRERGGGAEGGDEVDAGGALVGGGERGHYGLEVGGAGELKLRRLRADGGSRDHNERGERRGLGA